MGGKRVGQHRAATTSCGSTSSGIGPFGQSRSAAVPRLPRHGLVGRRRSRHRDASATSTRRTTTPSIDFDRRRSTSCPTRARGARHRQATLTSSSTRCVSPSAATFRSTSGSTATGCCAGCAWTSTRRRRSGMSMAMDLDDFGVDVDVEAPPADQVTDLTLGARRPRRRRRTTTDPGGPPPNLAGVEPVTPSVGWGVLHLFYRVDRERAEREPGAAKRIVDAVASLEADGHQALLLRGARPQGRPRRDGARPRPRPAAGVPAGAARGTPLDPGRTRTCRSPSCRSTPRPRTTSGPGSRPRRASPAPRVEARLAAWRERMAHYREQRIHPQLPAEADDLLLPDVEAPRRDDANWYALPFEERKRAHGRPRARRAHLRRARAAAHHRLHRARRLGVGRHAARRRPGRAEGDRLRDALRSRCRRATPSSARSSPGCVLEPADALRARRAAR